MIKCAVCGEEFAAMITWRHLLKHNISTEEYKQKHGDVVTQEYRDLKSKQNSGSNNPNAGGNWSAEQKQALSNKRKGSTPWNQGIAMSEEQKQQIRDRALERNRIWRETDSHPVVGQRRSEETRRKIREKRALQVIDPESARKAVHTKIKKYGKIIGGFNGKKHSQETKDRISASVRSQVSKKSLAAAVRRVEQAAALGLQIVSEENQFVHLRCEECDHSFSITKQYFTASKLPDTTVCRVCNPTPSHSKAEIDLLSNIRELNPDLTIVSGNRKEIFPLELDIWIPKHRIAVEYCGLYWHSEVHKTQDYHLKKLRACQSKGIDLITVFEDEWVQNRDLVLSMIQYRIGKHNKRIHARDCVVKEININDCRGWLEANHMQGAGRSKYKLGAYYQDQLVAVMTFIQGEVSRKNTDTWEINRFAVCSGITVPGIASRLFRRFIKEKNPSSVISYSDLRWGSGKVYEHLGFVRSHNTVPNYWYFTMPNLTRMHRFSLRKQPNEPAHLSERELRKEQGYLRIYDCGNTKWTWKRAT